MNRPHHWLVGTMSLFLAIILLLAATPYAAADDDDDDDDMDQMTLKLLSVNNIGDRGDNSDVWVLGDFAYMGNWGSSRVCPSVSGDPRVGTAIVDISDPERPTVASVINIPPGTRANDIKVAHIETDAFEGDLLAHSLELCTGAFAGTAPVGFRLFDVTDGYNPVFLGSFNTGDADPHNLFVYQAGESAFVMTAEPGANFLAPHLGGDGIPADMRIVDVSDPTNPVQVGQYNIFLQDPAWVQGATVVHDVWVNDAGDKALVSHWDAGLILADISNPAAPVALGRFSAWPAEPGNHHSAVFAHNDQIAVLNDEFFGCPWGFMRIIDLSDPANMNQIATVEVPQTRVCPPTQVGDFSVHNPYVIGNLLYESWYSAGILVFDISDPASPVLVAQFNHDGGARGDFQDPVLPDAPEFWGVIAQDDLVLGSDMHGGLFVLKLTELDDEDDEDDEDD